MDTDERMCQKFKQEFRKQLEFYKDNPDGLLFAYGAALNVFAKRLNSRPNSKHISETWNELIRSVLMTMLDINKQPKAAALKKFVTILPSWTENEGGGGISDIKQNISMLHNLSINGAWEKPIFQSLVNKKDIDMSELYETLQKEPSLVVVNRVRALHKNKLKTSMLNVIDAALMDEKFRGDAMFQECFQSHILYNNKAEYLTERCKDFDFAVSLKVLEKLDQEDEKEMSVTFSEVVMNYIWLNDLITSDIEKLTTSWCKIKLAEFTNNLRFVDFLKGFVRQEEKGPKSVTHCLIFMQIIWEMVGNQSREVCSDILMRALRLLATESDPDNQNKIQILETIARLLPKTNVSRLCLLCVFFLEPCIETYYCVSDAFNSTLKNEGTKSAELQTELLLHINNEFPKGSQFEMLDWNQINEECLTKLSPEDVNLLLNDSRSPLERQTSESTDTSIDDESSATQEDISDATKCSTCTADTTCDSCQEKVKPVKEKPPKKRKKKKYGWTCPVDLCKVLSGRMMYLCTHLKSKHQWAKEEINAFVKSLGVKKTAIWTSTNDNLVLLHKAQMQIHEGDRNPQFHDSVSRQSSSASDQEQTVPHDKQTNDKTDKDNVSEEKTNEVEKENGNNADQIKLDISSSEINNGSSKEHLDAVSENDAWVDFDNKVENDSKNERQSDNALEISENQEISGFQNVINTSSPKATITDEAVDISSENVTNASAEVTQTVGDSTSNIVMQADNVDKTELVSQASHGVFEPRSKSSETPKSSKPKKDRHSLSQEREHKEKHKSMKKKHEKSRRKTVDGVITPKRKISTERDVKTSKPTTEEKKSALLDNSIPQQPTFKPSEVTKLFPDVKDPGYVCPIQDCNRVFMHRHTIVAHIRFRHKKNQTVAETLAETAKPADAAKTSAVENKIIKSRGWYLCVDAHIHEGEDEKVPDISTNTDTRKFVIECVRHLFKRPLMNFNYNVACKDIVKWPTLSTPMSESPSTPDENYFGLPADIIESNDQSHLEKEISKNVDNGVVTQSIRPSTPVPENDDYIAEDVEKVPSFSKKVKKHKVKKFNRGTQTRHGDKVIKSATDREIIPTVAMSKIKKLQKPKEHNPSPTVMTGLAFGKKPMRTIAVQIDYTEPLSAKKRRTSKDIVKKSKVDVKQELKKDETDAKRRETPKPNSQEGIIDLSESSPSIPKKRMNKGISFEQALADPNIQERNQEVRMKPTQKPAAQIRHRPSSNSQPITTTKLHNIDHGDAHKVKHISLKSEEKRSKSSERKKHKSETHRKHSHESSASVASSREERPSSPERLSSVADYNDLIERAKQIAGDDWSDSSKHSSSEKASSKQSLNINTDDTKTTEQILKMKKQKSNKNKRSIDLRKLSSITSEDEIAGKVRKFDETTFSESTKLDSESTTAGDKHKCGICGRIMANGFALACHMRKKHKSKAKMFIPESDDIADEKHKAKVRKKSSDGTKKNVPIKQAKNAEPVYKEGRLSTIECAQAEIATLPQKEKSFEILTKRQLMLHYFCKLYYCPEYRQLLERKKDIIVKRSNVAGLSSELFSNESKRLVCPASACVEDFLRYDCLKVHLSEKHNVHIRVLLQNSVDVVKNDFLRKCSSCKSDFAEFTDLFNHVMQNPNCRETMDIDGDEEVHKLGTNLNLQCLDCKSQLTNFRSLIDHMRRTHKQPLPSLKKSEKLKELMKWTENTWHRVMNSTLANEAALLTKTSIVPVEESEEIKSVDEKSDVDVNESEEDVRHITDSGIEVLQDCEGSQEDKIIVEDQPSVSTYDDLSSAEDSQDDIFVPKECHPSETSDQDTLAQHQSTSQESDMTVIEVLRTKALTSESSIDNQSLSEDSYLISDGNVSSEMDMDVSEDTVDIRSKVGEAKNLRRLAYTQAARKIAMKTPEKFNRRRWAEFQNLHALYNKRALKKVALSLSPAKKMETPVTVEPIEEPSKAEALAVVKKVSSGSCWICKDDFVQGSNYQNHILYHLRNIDRHENRCDFAGCLYAFKDEDELIEHQLLHEGAVHKCLFCFGPAYFASAIDLLDHEKEHHSSAVKMLRKLRKKFCINQFLKSEMRRRKRKRTETAANVENQQIQDDKERFLCCRHRKRLDIRTEINCACDGENEQFCSGNCCQDDNEYCNSVFLRDFVPEIRTNICDIMTDVLDTLNEAEQQPIEIIENYDDFSYPDVANLDPVTKNKSQDILLSSTPQPNLSPFVELDEVLHYGSEDNKVSLVDDTEIHSDLVINIPRIDSELLTTTIVSTCEILPLKIVLSPSDVKPTDTNQNDNDVNGIDAENDFKTTVAIPPEIASENNLVIVNDGESNDLEKISFEADDIEIFKPNDFHENSDTLAVEKYHQNTPTQFESMNTSFLNPERGYIANLVDAISDIDIEEGVLYLEVASVLERIVTTVECAAQCDMFKEMGQGQFIGLLPLGEANYTGTEESVVALIHENADDESCHSKDVLNLFFENSSALQTETTITIIPDTDDHENDKLSPDDVVENHKSHIDEVAPMEDKLVPHDGSHNEMKELNNFLSGENIGCVFSLSADKKHYMSLSSSKSAEAFKRVFGDGYDTAFFFQVETPAIGWKNVESTVDSDATTVTNVCVETANEATSQPASAVSETLEKSNMIFDSPSVASTSVTKSVNEKKASHDNSSTASVDLVGKSSMPSVDPVGNSSMDSVNLVANSSTVSDSAVKKSGPMKKSQGKKGKFVANDPFRDFRGRLSNHTKHLEKQEIPEVWEPDEELFLKMFPSMAEDSCASTETQKKRTRKSSTGNLPKRLKKSNSLDSGSLIPVATKLKESNITPTSPISFFSSELDICHTHTEHDVISMINNPRRPISSSILALTDHSDASIKETARSMLRFPTICGFCLESVLAVDLLRHLIAHFQNPQNVIKCAFGGNQCFYKCRSEMELRNHYKRHLNFQPFLCMFCCAKFPDRVTLEQHQSTLHRLFKKEFLAELKRLSDAKKATIVERSLPLAKVVSAVSDVMSFMQPERPSVIVHSNPSCADGEKSFFLRTDLLKSTSRNSEPLSKFRMENSRMSFNTKQNSFCTSTRPSVTLPTSNAGSIKHPSAVENGSVLVLDLGLGEDDNEILPNINKESQSGDKEQTMKSHCSRVTGDLDNVQTSNLNVSHTEDSDFDGLSALANACSLVEKVSKEKVPSFNSDDALDSHNVEKSVAEGQATVTRDQVSINTGENSETICANLLSKDQELISMKQIFPRSQSSTVSHNAALLNAGHSYTMDQNQAKSCHASVPIPVLSPSNSSGNGNQSFRSDGTHYLPNVPTPSPINIFPIRRYSMENIPSNDGCVSQKATISNIFPKVGDSVIVEGNWSKKTKENENAFLGGNSVAKRSSSNLESSLDDLDPFPISYSERQREVHHSIRNAERLTGNLQSLNMNVSKPHDSLLSLLLAGAKKKKDMQRLGEGATETNSFPFCLDKFDLKKSDGKPFRIPMNLPRFAANLSKDVDPSIGDETGRVAVNMENWDANVSKTHQTLLSLLQDGVKKNKDTQRAIKEAERVVLNLPRLDEDSSEVNDFPFHVVKNDLKINDGQHLNSSSLDVTLSEAQNSFFLDSHINDRVKKDGHYSILQMDRSASNATNLNAKVSESHNTLSKDIPTCHQTDSNVQKSAVRKMFKLIRPAPVTLFPNTDANSVHKIFSESRFLKCSTVTECIDLKDSFKKNNSILYTSASKSADIRVVQAPKSKEPLCAVTRSPPSECRVTASDSGTFSEPQKSSLSGLSLKTTMKKYRGNYLFPASMLLSCSSNNTDLNQFYTKISRSQPQNITNTNSSENSSIVAPRVKDNTSAFRPISLPENIADQNRNENNANWNFHQSSLTPKSNIITIDDLNRDHNYQKFTARPLQSTNPISRQISDPHFTSISYRNSQPEIIRFVKPTARKVQIVRPVMRAPITSKTVTAVSSSVSTLSNQAQATNSARLFQNALADISPARRHLNPSEGGVITSQPLLTVFSVSNPMEQQVINSSTTQRSSESSLETLRQLNFCSSFTFPISERSNPIEQQVINSSTAQQSPETNSSQHSIATSVPTSQSSINNTVMSYRITYDNDLIEVAESQNSDQNVEMQLKRDEKQDDIVAKTEIGAVVSSPTIVKNSECVTPGDNKNSLLGIVSIGIDQQVTDEDSDVFMSDEEDGDNHNDKHCCGLRQHFQDSENKSVESFDLCPECGSTSASRRGLEVVEKTPAKRYDHALMKEVWDSEDNFLKKYCLDRTLVPSYMAEKYRWKDVKREAYEDLKAYTYKALSIVKNDAAFGMLRCPLKTCIEMFPLRRDLYRHLCAHSSKKLVHYLRLRFHGIHWKYIGRLNKRKASQDSYMQEIICKKRCRFASCGRVFESDAYKDSIQVQREFRSHMRSHSYVCGKLEKVGNCLYRVFESTVPLENIVQPKKVSQSGTSVKSCPLDDDEEETEDIQCYEEFSETDEVDSECTTPSPNLLNCSVKLSPVTGKILTLNEDTTSNLAQAKVALVRLENLDCGK